MLESTYKRGLNEKVFRNIITFYCCSCYSLVFCKRFFIERIFREKMSKANNAPVTIGSVDLDYFESYVTLKDIKIMSNLHKDEIFISIDELKVIMK